MASLEKDIIDGGFVRKSYGYPGKSMEKDKRYNTGGMVENLKRPIFERGWWMCGKCGCVFEAYTTPPTFEHICKEDKKMDGAYFQYKCRLCKETYDMYIVPVGNAGIILSSAILGISLPQSFPGHTPPMISIHESCNLGCGISDLIGYVVKKE